MQGTSVWFAAERRIELRPEEVPAPREGEITVRTALSLISAGTEMLVYRGQCTGPEDLVLERPGRAGTYPFPVKYAYQLVGTVVEAGPGSGFAPGARVFVQHPHQDIFTIPVSGGLKGAVMPLESVFPVPDDLPLERAVLAHLFAVSLSALLDSPVRVGECVAVSGLGVVGIFIAHLARLTATRLVLIEPNPWRRAFAGFLGADAVVAPEEAPPAIKEITGGRGVDLHFEASGAPAALRASLSGLAKEGTVVVASNYGNRPVQLFLSPEFHNKRLKIISSQAGGIAAELLPRWDRRRRMGVAMDQLRRYDFAHMITHRFPLAEAAAAYETLDRPDGETLGVALTYPQTAA